jgi:hypothetical protein
MDTTVLLLVGVEVRVGRQKEPSICLGLVDLSTFNELLLFFWQESAFKSALIDKVERKIHSKHDNKHCSCKSSMVPD